MCDFLVTPILNHFIIEDNEYCLFEKQVEYQLKDDEKEQKNATFEDVAVVQKI